MAHTEQQAIKGPKLTGVKPFKQENQRSNLYKNEKRDEPHQHTTTTEHQITELGHLQTNATGSNLNHGLKQ